MPTTEHGPGQITSHYLLTDVVCIFVVKAAKAD